MTTLTSAARTAPVAAPPARFRDLLASEWIKMRSLRSTPWTIALTLLFVIGSAAVASACSSGGIIASTTCDAISILSWEVAAVGLPRRMTSGSPTASLRAPSATTGAAPRAPVSARRLSRC